MTKTSFLKKRAFQTPLFQNDKCLNFYLYEYHFGFICFVVNFRNKNWVCIDKDEFIEFLAFFGHLQGCDGNNKNFGY